MTQGKVNVAKGVTVRLDSVFVCLCSVHDGMLRNNETVSVLAK